MVPTSTHTPAKMLTTNIKESWRNSQLFKDGKVELVPTDWVWKYWGRDVSTKTNLMDGTEVDLDGLWKNICDEGLHDPLIMRIGVRNNKFRLEAGNHRIQVLHSHHILMVPLTVQIQGECGPHVGNVMTDATHNFDYSDNLASSKVERYVKPSEVFKSLHHK